MENKKKGLLERLSGSKKAKKGSCCSFEIEELSQENSDNKGGEDSSKPKENSCCD